MQEAQVQVVLKYKVGAPGALLRKRALVQPVPSSQIQVPAGRARRQVLLGLPQRSITASRKAALSQMSRVELAHWHDQTLADQSRVELQLALRQLLPEQT
jgi:hypothetical protein